MAKKEEQALIAKVMVTCYVKGVRTDVQPGQELPADLPEHDIEQLKRMGSIEDPAETAAEERASRRATAKGDSEFQAARTRVLNADESTRQAVAGAEGSGETKKD